jgi:hypothetical protein
MFFRVIFICLVGFLFSNLTFGEEMPNDRVAFVIGNAAYKGGHALANPVNDSRAVASFLRNQGFETFERNDLKVKDVGELRQQFEKRINRNSVLFFYYAGHGVQVEGRNYLAPVDAPFNSSEALADDSLYLGDILAVIEKRRPRLAVVILDACRDNPFAKEKTTTARKGLARVDPPSSTVVFYATRPGGVASDGVGGNGLFTKALLDEFQNHDAPIEVLFRRVSSSVYKTSKGDQEPWLEGVIRQEFALAAPSKNSLPNETVKIPEIAMNNSPSPVGVNSPQLVSLSDDEVRARIRAIKASDSVDLSTSVICDESGCFDYSKWSALLSEPSRLESLKGSLQSLIQKKDGQFCEFNADRFDCENDDHIKMTVIYPLAPFHPRKAIGGFTWIEPKITRSGGVSFKLSPITSGGLPGTCLDTEGGMQFALNRIEFPVSRMTCFNLIVPGSVKQDFQILMMDLKRKEMLVYWDWSVISFMAYGSGRHLVKVKF